MKRKNMWYNRYNRYDCVSLFFYMVQDGVEVVKSGKESCVISNKRPSKNSNKPLLYGRFVKVFNTLFEYLIIICQKWSEYCWMVLGIKLRE